jgi:hypothetical protein
LYTGAAQCCSKWHTCAVYCCRSQAGSAFVGVDICSFVLLARPAWGSSLSQNERSDGAILGSGRDCRMWNHPVFLGAASNTYSHHGVECVRKVFAFRSPISDASTGAAAYRWGTGGFSAAVPLRYKGHLAAALVLNFFGTAKSACKTLRRRRLPSQRCAFAAKAMGK